MAIWKKNVTKIDFLGYPLSNSTMTSNFDKIKNFKNQHIAKSLKFILGLKFFEKISFMDHNVWFQIRGLFDGFLHHTILFPVFMLIMTSFCYFLSSPPHLCIVRGVINTAADFSAYCISTIYLWSTLKLNFRSAPRQI